MKRVADKPNVDALLRRRVVAAICNEPWAILPEKLELIAQVIVERILYGKLPEEATTVIVDHRAEIGDEPTWSTIPIASGKSIAVLPIHGVLSKRLNMFAAISGGTSADNIAAAARALAKDDSVAGVVLDVDSPGGQVAGTEAAAAAVKDLAKAKPVYAVANDMMASAAYWLASPATKILMPKTAFAGSVGIAMTHFDRSRKYDKEGVKPTIVTTGKFKAVGADHTPLDDEAIAIIRERMQGQFDEFVDAVAANRGISVADVKDKIADGRIFTGKNAIGLKLADSIGTLETAIAKLTGVLTSASSKGVFSMAGNANAGGDVEATAADPTKPETKVGDLKPATAVDLTTGKTIDPNAAKPGEPLKLDQAAIVAEARKAERERCQELRGLVATASLDASIAEQFIDADISVDVARKRIFEIMAEKNKAAAIGGSPAGTPPSQSPQTEEAKAAALKERAKKAYDAQAATYAAGGVEFGDAFVATFAREEREREEWKKQQAALA